MANNLLIIGKGASSGRLSGQITSAKGGALYPLEFVAAGRELESEECHVCCERFRAGQGWRGHRDVRAGARPGRARPGRWAWPAGYALAAILLFLCYLRVSGTQVVTSDGASQALQAWDMLHGNWLLKGWTLTDVSFYTTELPEY